MKSLVNRRKFEYGRRKGDKPEITLSYVPIEDYKDILNDIVHLLHTWPTARDYLEEVLSKAQESGFSFDKEVKIK